MCSSEWISNVQRNKWKLFQNAHEATWKSSWWETSQSHDFVSASDSSHKQAGKHDAHYLKAQSQWGQSIRIIKVFVINLGFPPNHTVLEVHITTDVWTLNLWKLPVKWEEKVILVIRVPTFSAGSSNVLLCRTVSTQRVSWEWTHHEEKVGRAELRKQGGRLPVSHHVISTAREPSTCRITSCYTVSASLTGLWRISPHSFKLSPERKFMDCLKICGDTHCIKKKEGRKSLPATRLQRSLNSLWVRRFNEFFPFSNDLQSQIKQSRGNYHAEQIYKFLLAKLSIICLCSFGHDVLMSSGPPRELTYTGTHKYIGNTRGTNGASESHRSCRASFSTLFQLQRGIDCLEILRWNLKKNT